MFVGDRLKTSETDFYLELCDISCDSNSVPSIKNDNVDKYIHLPNRKRDWKKNSLEAKSNMDQPAPVQNSDNRVYINLVGCWEKDLKVIGVLSSDERFIS